MYISFMCKAECLRLKYPRGLSQGEMSQAEMSQAEISQGIVSG